VEKLLGVIEILLRSWHTVGPHCSGKQESNKRSKNKELTLVAPSRPQTACNYGGKIGLSRIKAKLTLKTDASPRFGFVEMR